jgi:hypothetical protein
MTEGRGWLAQLDVLDLTPGLEVTKVYDVPGTALTVFAAAAGTEDGASVVDMAIYGFASPQEDTDRYRPAPRAGVGASLDHRLSTLWEPRLAGLTEPGSRVGVPGSNVAAVEAVIDDISRH